MPVGEEQQQHTKLFSEQGKGEIMRAWLIEQRTLDTNAGKQQS